MAKKKGQARGDEVIDISFVGDGIEDVIKTLEKQLKTLPPDARKARRVVKGAIVGLKLTAATTKLHCGPRWFMPPL